MNPDRQDVAHQQERGDDGEVKPERRKHELIVGGLRTSEVPEEEKRSGERRRFTTEARRHRGLRRVWGDQNERGVR